MTLLPWGSFSSRRPHGRPCATQPPWPRLTSERRPATALSQVGGAVFQALTLPRRSGLVGLCPVGNTVSRRSATMHEVCLIDGGVGSCCSVIFLPWRILWPISNGCFLLDEGSETELILECISRNDLNVFVSDHLRHYVVRLLYSPLSPLWLKNDLLKGHFSWLGVELVYITNRPTTVAYNRSSC